MQILNRIIFKLILAIAVAAPIISSPLGGVSNAKTGWLTKFPYCEDAKVHSRIIERYNKADRTLWYSGFEITHISAAVETSYNPFADSSINRRYCRANVTLSNSRKSTVHFLIEEGMGFAGTGWNVEYCVPGSDRWHAYGGWCRVLRR